MSDFTNNYFSTTVHFHNGELPLSYEEIGIPENTKFGIITHTVSEVPMDQAKTALIITIDTSGSMNEGDRNSKISHVKQTVRNILRVISEKAMPISVQIGSFNSEYKEIVELSTVSPHNLEDLISKIDQIQANYGTNIESALYESNRVLDKYADSFGKVYHFFLTDGHATDGECSDKKLSEKVIGKYPTAYIGYGYDHNANLLIQFSKKGTNESSYQLVDDFETIGNLCGELLFNICYPAVKNVYVCTPSEHDLVYDAITNTWSNNISVGTFVSGKVYIYPIYTTENHAMLVNTFGTNLDGEKIDKDVYIEPADPQMDLTKEIFRHAANRLLFLSTINRRENKTKVRDLFKKIRIYAREHDLLSDTYYKLIFDDLYTCYMGQDMSIQARLISNSRNQTFRANSSMRRYNQIDSGLYRTPSVLYNDFEEQEFCDEENNEDTVDIGLDDDDLDIMRFVSDNTQNDINATQAMYGIMREVSS